MIEVKFFKNAPGGLSWAWMVFPALLAFLFHPVQGQFQQPTEICSMPFQPVALPLTELGEDEYIRMDGQATGFKGGLYPNGSNTRPAQHEAAGLDLSRQIQPLNSDGQVDENNGRILFISIGMSNTATEFGAFIRLAEQKAELNPKVILLNGALPNQIAERWSNPEGIAWQELDRRITGYGFSSQQVQVAWVKLTNTGGGEFPQKALALQSDLQVIVQHLKTKFPNLKLVFLSSRTRSYTYWRGLSPEPLAYETSFAVKWLIEKQIQGDPQLNYNPTNGEVKAAFLSWGPYLWADGENPRQDGFTWLASDLTGDCTHPSPLGAEKVAQQLWEFFSTDTISRDWFISSGTAASPVQTVKLTETPGSIRVTPSKTLEPNKVEVTFTLPAMTPSSTTAIPIPQQDGEIDESPLVDSFPFEIGLFLLAVVVCVSAVYGWLRSRKGKQSR